MTAAGFKYVFALCGTTFLSRLSYTLKSALGPVETWSALGPVEPELKPLRLTRFHSKSLQTWLQTPRDVPSLSVTLSFTHTNPSKLVKDMGALLCFQQFLPQKVNPAACAWVSLPFPRAEGEVSLITSVKCVPCKLKISMT